MCLNSSGKALLAALKQGDMQQAEALIKEDPGLVNAGNESGDTLLHWAASAGFGGIVQKLLVLGAEVNARNALGMTPLHLATAQGHSDIVELLITKGAEVNVATPQGFTALHMAVYKGHEEVVRVLLDHNAEVNAQDKPYTMSPLDLAEESGNAEIREMLVAKGARAHATWNR